MKDVRNRLSALLCAVVVAGRLATGQTTVVEPPSTLPSHAATATGGMVATVNPLATDAGLRAMSEGGNAVDAAIAAAIMLSVVDCHNSGMGGGCFVLIRRADGKLVAIDGREMAPAAAKRDMFIRHGKADPSLSRHGPLASGVPGALAAYDMALRENGNLPLDRLIAWAADCATDGFRVDRVLARTIQANRNKLANYPGLARILLKPNGEPYAAGELLKNPDLANSYRHIASEGPAWFYRGAFAQEVAQWMAAHGGLITAEDFANYVAKQRTPLRTTYRGLDIVGFPPPSSGGVHVAQMLNILEHFELAELHRNDPAQATHVIVEAMKLAFADRAYWLGDSDFVDVPQGLADKTYADCLARRIDLDQVTAVPQHSVPDGWEQNLFSKHTTHITAADAEGNWVAITATVNTSFGSKVVVPGTGILLNNEMDDFSAQPGVPNIFGLLGAENNAVEPGKRPLSCMSPTIVLRDGQPILTVGAAGGPKIITQTLLAIVRHLDYGWPLHQAIAEPRFHHQWMPDRVHVESDFPATIGQRLRERGHTVVTGSSGGRSQAIARLPDGTFMGVHDPRVPGKAAGL